MPWSQVQISGEIKYLEHKMVELKKAFGVCVFEDMRGPHGMMGDGEYVDNDIVMNDFVEKAQIMSEYKLKLAEKMQEYDDL